MSASDVPEPQATIDKLPIGVYRTTPEGRIVDANLAVVAMLEFPDRASLLGTPARDLYAEPEERERVLARAVREGQILGLETRLRRRDGRVFWARINTFVERAADGRPLSYVGTIEDVTERRVAEEALWESEARSRMLLEQIPAVLWTTDRDLRSTLSEGAALESLNLRPNQLQGVRIADYMGTSGAAVSTVDAHRRALRGEPLSYEQEWEGRTFEAHVRPLRGPDGAIVGTLGMALDVTDRRRLEHSDRERTRRIRSLMEASVAASTADSLRQALQAVADGARTILGAGHAEAASIGGGGRETITVGSGLDPRSSGSEAPAIEMPLVGRGGVLGTLRVSDKRGGGFTDDDRVMLAQLAHTASVIAEHKRAEAALREGEERMRALYEKERAAREQAERLRAATAALGSTLDLREVLALILRELQRVVPYDSASIQELRGDRLVVIAGHGFPELDRILGTVFDIGAEDNPNREVCRTRRPLLLKNAPASFPGFVAGIHAAAGIRAWIGVPLLFGDRLIGMLTLDKTEPDFYAGAHVRLAEAFAAPAAVALENARLYAAARDELEERRRVEDQFRQSQKMEAVGRLAGGIAHDFNNLLGVILGYTELAFRGLAPADPARPRLEQVRKAAERASALTGQLLAFSRKQVLVPEILDLAEVVGDLSSMLRRVIGEDVELVTNVPEGLGPVRADRGQLGQALLNLAVNAREAMPRGGTLAIEARDVAIGEAEAREHGGLGPGDYVMLAVSDSGGGMPADVQRQIFEPFFTTKEPGKGTGLGLSMVYGFLKQSDGHVAVVSEPGRGTTFRLFLPRVREAAPAPAAAPPPPATAPADGGTETILVVEDAGSLREMITEILTGSGYRVLEAGTAERALELAKKDQGAIDLLLTDVVMPKMSGAELAEALQRLRRVKVLFMSGYTDDAVVQRGVLAREAALIQKPFSSSALLARIREVLGAPPAARRRR